ncbi:polysaccharide deacetylase [Bacillus luteolus]|uniref:Polysaccharide deacetylase n=1 Tax=Litchfieldia luteola TaxID=682179 RepID=A0ABR9QNS0_9BACI|nr:polysaccharide deacetylase family protein [Cytobacillus luteolus]MBE4910150.1 polysaccharide deacetylase [Cytobacillus luteolus]MBP1942284.1 peptidoglycan/xylan/chitin deacetylase (PgdA/CDA1 family) [Cytobacillus luteolus]
MKIRYFHLYTTITLLTFLLFFITNVLYVGISSQQKRELFIVNALEKRSISSDDIVKSPLYVVETRELGAHSTLFSRDEKTIYLTFDDGPTKYTEGILNILLEKNIQATFFLLKSNIDKYPALVSRIHKDGHSIGCHGVTHDLKQFYATPDSPIDEMNQCFESISSIIDHPSNLIRVPFGSYPYMKQEHRDLLSLNGYLMWDWNVDSEDWSNSSGSFVKKNVIEQVSSLSIKNITPVVLLHDKKVTSDILSIMIDELRKQDYTFSKITEDLKPLQFKNKASH